MNLKNTKNIFKPRDMGKYEKAVITFINVFNLPSYSYPEVYERLITQLDLKLDEEDPSMFDLGDDSSWTIREIHKLDKEIKKLEKEDKLFFQIRIKGI